MDLAANNKGQGFLQTQIQTDRDTYRHTHRDTQRHMEADTARHTGRHTDTYRQTHSHTNTYRYTETHKTHTVTAIRLVSCFLYFVLAPPLSADSESIWPLSSCLHLFAKSHKIPQVTEVNLFVSVIPISPKSTLDSLL